MVGMDELKITHLASFTGNIGDNASHIGLRNILSDIIGDNFEMNRLEIRKTYNNYSLNDKINFDDDFVKLVNKKDLLIIGGGGFLDFWVENTRTGTTIDMSEEILNKINVPILITSVGSKPHKEVPEGNVKKFKNFLDILLDKENVNVMIRNDGSKKTIKNYLGEKYSSQIPQILDNGFFYKNNEDQFSLISDKYVVINTTIDQIRMENNQYIDKIDEDIYHSELSKVAEYIIEQTELDIIFVPHIYKDLRSISRVLDNINDFYVRTRVEVAPYLHGDEGCNKLFKLYKDSEFIIGMRFHSNICSLAMNKFSIGLAALDRVIDMYDELGLGDRYIKVDGEFSDRLIEKIDNLYPHRSSLIKKSKKSVRKEKEDTLSKYREVIESIVEDATYL